MSWLPYEIIILRRTLWLRDGPFSTLLEVVLAPVALDLDLQQRRLLRDQRRRWGVLRSFLNAEGYKLVLVLFKIYCVLRRWEYFVNLVQNIDFQHLLSVLNLSLWSAFMTCLTCWKMHWTGWVWRICRSWFWCFSHIDCWFWLDVDILVLLSLMDSHEGLVDEVVIRRNEFINEIIGCVGGL